VPNLFYEKTLLLKDTAEDILTAASFLRDGHLVAIPTETVYGLAADAFNEQAVSGIFRAKGRPADNPLIVHIGSIDDIHRYNLASEFSEEAKKLARAFWPGALTIIVKKTDTVSKTVSAGLDTVAIRFPSHTTAQKIIQACGFPLAAPSANISGKPSPTQAGHVIHDLSGKIAAVVDGGLCTAGLESTVISASETPCRLLRPGTITVSQIESVIGKIIVDDIVLTGIKDTSAPPKSPGMKYKHYAPNAKVILLKCSSEQFVNFINTKSYALRLRDYETHLGHNIDIQENNILCLCYNHEVSQLKTKTISIGAQNDYKAQSQNLFSCLRKADTLNNILLIFAHVPEITDIGLAVYNRLIRAAKFEIWYL